MATTKYHIGPLFPRKKNGDLNLVLSKSLEVIDRNGKKIVKSSKNTSSEDLNVKLSITSEPINIPGANLFLNKWLIPQLKDTESENSLFNQIKDVVVGNWSRKSRNESMYTLNQIGYIGAGSKNSSTNTSFWNALGTSEDEIYSEIQKIENYKPEKRWNLYKNTTNVKSNFDRDSLLENLNSDENAHQHHHHDLTVSSDSTSEDKADYWHPSILYTYKIPGQGTSYPGPVMMLEPGEELAIDFSNNIEIPELTEEQIQEATLITNSLPGLTGGAGHGGTTSTNYHLHGAHVHPGGFADNVVSRYTTGQEWTTKIDIPGDHGMGSYWYHPHYHPAVNQQLYGGASGFLQIGDPLSKIPGFNKVPRNLAVIKSINVIPEDESGDLVLTGYDILGSVTQSVAMPTVNGAFQPNVDVDNTGWQALTLSNQDNGAYYNIRLIHTDDSGKTSNLPMYIYGEDGHQYPQIRKAVGALGKADNNSSNPYSKAENLVALPPGKRIDLLTYLPQGKTEIASVYSFSKEDGISYEISNYDIVGEYPDLTSKNQEITNGSGGPGPLAVFNVKGSGTLPSKGKLDQEIADSNELINVQKITPLTTADEYDTEKIPSVNLFNKDWQPLRKRQFDWSIATLVGPVEERDAATQEAIAQYDSANPDSPYQKYQLLPSVPANEAWLGAYPGPPFLINDHVFPNGNLIIAQLGTMEEWKLRNWSSTLEGSIKYVGHPFHIHINDYQVKNSDSELSNKRNLEDVTSLNSSGYYYKQINPDTNEWELVANKPLNGKLHKIKEAYSENSDVFDKLVTYGANDQKVRMIFQDYLGTYVMHCHMIPHEDAGMMQVITVVENTDSSWLIPVEDLKIVEGNIQAYQARTMKPVSINLDSDSSLIRRAQVGDVTSDYVQDIILSSTANKGSGSVQILDGAALQEGRTFKLTNFSPHKSSDAPWAFLEDFDGDGLRDLLTAGFNQNQKNGINLEKLQIRAWDSENDSELWIKAFEFNPFTNMDLKEIQEEEKSVAPDSQLNINQLSVAIADVNLDNFQDIAISYLVDNGVRVVVLDGAALALTNQTGKVEGGYLPNENILADAIIQDENLIDSEKIILSSGFSSYAQSALENIILSTSKDGQNYQYTLQLQAGHFIASSKPEDQNTNSSDQGVSVHNLNENLFPLSVAEKHKLSSDTSVASPVIAGSLANGALLLDEHLAIAQGNSANGNSSTSNKIYNTAQQLIIDISQVNKANKKDIDGVVNTSLDSTYSKNDSNKRLNMTNLAYYSYTGETMSPSYAAKNSALILGKGGNPKDLVDEFLSDKLISERVVNQYGGDLNDLSTSEIVAKTTSELYGRKARSNEIQAWEDEVSKGLDPQYLPLSILQSTSKDDQYHVGFLSSASQWNQLQWGTGAALDGSFGQGMRSDHQRFDALNRELASVEKITSWDASEKELENYIDFSVGIFNAGNVSKTGFF